MSFFVRRIHNRLDRTGAVRFEYERMVLNAQVVAYANITQTFDGELGGSPTSDKFLGFDQASQETVLGELAGG